MSLSLHGKTNAEEICRKRTKTLSLFDYANDNRQAFCDVEVRAGNRSISANKMVLSCSSKFFEKLFKTEMKEKYENLVAVEMVDYDSMKNMIDFMYAGSIIINSKNICDLLLASDYLIVEEVKEFCFEYLQKAVSPENCFTICNIANRYQNMVLKDYIQQYISENFADIVSTESFKHLSKDDLMRFFLNGNRKKVEILIYNAILEWTNFEHKSREKHFPELFNALKLEEIPSWFLKDIVSKEDLVKNNFTCCKRMMETLSNYSDVMSAQHESQIISLGGIRTGMKVFEVFNCMGKPAQQFPDLPESLCSGSSIKLDNFLYYIGGMFSGKSSAKMWQLNLKESGLKWKPVSSLNVPRSYFGCAVFNESIVSCGGFGQRANLVESNECYLPSWDAWSEIKPLPSVRFGHSLVACKEWLFALGGVNGGIYLSTVECFKPGNKTWVSLSPMQTSRYAFAAVNCNDFIYAIGGKSGLLSSVSLKSCEKYDVGNNGWTFISEMNFCRFGCSACVLQGKIYVVGGEDENEKAVKEIECYDPSTNQWKIVAKTDHELYHHSLVVL